MSIKNRGFASMTPEARRRIASMGGKAAHRLGTAHEWDRAEAREAGRKGGRASAARKPKKGADTEAAPTLGNNPGGVAPTF